MTIERAEFITKTVADLFAKKGKNLLPRSALHDWSFKMISQAFALTIAKYRQISDGSSEQEYFCKKYAENAAGLVALLKMTIIPNDEFSTMFRLPIDSPDLPLLRLRAIQRRLASETQEDIELSQQEALSAFNEFCWSLNPCSELYWQNVYTRVGLKYDENCPTGMPFLKKDTNWMMGGQDGFDYITPKKLNNSKRDEIVAYIMVIGFVVFLVLVLLFY